MVMTLAQARDYAENHIEPGEKVIYFLDRRGGWDVVHYDLRNKTDREELSGIDEKVESENESAFISYTPEA